MGNFSRVSLPGEKPGNEKADAPSGGKCRFFRFGAFSYGPGQIREPNRQVYQFTGAFFRLKGKQTGGRGISRDRPDPFQYSL